MFEALFAHPFVLDSMNRFQSAAVRASEYVRANSSRAAAARAENRARMSPAERYHAAVFQRVSGLLSTLRTLEDSLRLLRTFPAQLARGQDGISRDRWADYHYGVFTVSLASVPDVGVVLVAAVYSLGLAARHCTLDIVGDHSRIKGKPPGKALRELSKAVQEMKPRRHGHVHRGERADIMSVEASSSDEFLFHVKAMTFVESMKPGTVDRHLLSQSWREATRTIVPILKAEAVKVTLPLGALFDSLHNPYRATSTALGHVEPPSRAV
jgi:hypothetical protein